MSIADCIRPQMNILLEHEYELKLGLMRKELYYLHTNEITLVKIKSCILWK
ncbi:hypothetical protein FOWG_03434 [Fusarium oxysporum f. sp. lycopersici MN25]|nr:hypothetical protein FOWG_03434 [Fusarium oxysporum f. sp. lycopersici MN25]